MTIFQAVVLALVQGLTEFLPVSSSAHLILVPALLGWKDQGIAFDVIVHLGTLTAVIVYFYSELRAIAFHWCKQWTRGHYDPNHYAKLGNMLILATIPTGIIGLLGKDYITAYLRNPLVIAASTLIFGLILGWADRWRGHREIEKVSAKSAICYGLAQSLALIPGVSRSGITLTAGLFMGFTREAAAKFSFLMSIPIIILSGLLIGLELIEKPDPIAWSPLIVGFLVSAVSAYLCIAVFMKALAHIGMMPYVIYRILLALFLAVLAFNGVFADKSHPTPPANQTGKTVLTIHLNT